jgi:hypothetical protein
MVVRSTYNDATLGAAFNSLAAAFAPPSGSDLAGYASANATNAEAQRLAQLFTDAGAPGFNQSVFDRQAIAAGLYNPTQSFYAQDQNNGTARYGIDTTAATSRLNNAADNERALIETVMNNATAPVAQGAIRPGFNPADYGVSAPAVPQFAGSTAPLSETQVLGSIIQGLPQADQTALALSDIPIEQVIMDGNPQYVRRSDAVGQTPYTPSSGATETQNYRTPQGVEGTAYFDDASNNWRDTQTGAPLPQGAITYNTSLQGGGAETGLGPTTANTTTANNMEATLNGMDADIANLQTLLQENPGIAGLPGTIFGTAQNVASTAGEIAAAFGDMSPDAAVTAQQVQQAAQSITPNRNPAIQQYNMGIANLAYGLAKMNNPSGEVSRQAYERAFETLTGGILGNNQSALEALNELSNQVQRNRDTQLQTLRNPGQPTGMTAPRAPIAPGTVEDGYRFRGGDPADPASWEAVQ